MSSVAVAVRASNKNDNKSSKNHIRAHAKKPRETNSSILSKPSASAQQALSFLTHASNYQLHRIDETEEKKQPISIPQIPERDRPCDSVTTNGDGNYRSSGCARLDLFFGLVRGVDKDLPSLHGMCQRSWEEQAEHLVQLVLHCRDIRGGKGEKAASVESLLWLRENRPATYLLNLHRFIQLGYFKDLLQIAGKVCERRMNPMGQEVRKDLEEKWLAHRARVHAKAQAKKAQRQQQKMEQKSKQAAGDQQAAVKPQPSNPLRAAPLLPSAAMQSEEYAKSSSVVHEIIELEMLAEFLRADWKKLQQHKKRVAEITKQWEKQQNKKKEDGTEEKEESKESESEEESKSESNSDEEFLDSQLFEVVEEANAEVDHEAEWEELTKADTVAAAATAEVAPVTSLKEAMEKQQASSSSSSPAAAKTSGPRIPHLQLSLAAKWAPSEGSSFDRYYSFASRLAALLFPEIETEHGRAKAYRQMLSECRQHLQLTERFICAKQYDQIQFEKIPAKCHQLLRKALAKHCTERYSSYIEKVNNRSAKINTVGVMPHELAGPYVDYSAMKNGPDATVEGAWLQLVDRLKASCVSTGGLKSAVAVVDVSGSMMCYNGIPMKVAISLGLLVAELSEGPFANRCITFSEQPRWHTLPAATAGVNSSGSLFKRVQSVKGAHWGCSTDLYAVFDLILQVAKDNRLRQDELPKTLFIFSDMQFNSAVRGGSAENLGMHRNIQKAFRACGYEAPQLVYWNLNGACRGVPVDCSTPGVALIGGYSAELLKAFLEGKDLNPLNIMIDAISKYRVDVQEEER